MANPFVETASGFFGGIGTGLLWIVMALFIIGILGGLALYIRYKRKFDILVEIKSERAGDSMVVFYDKGAILTENKGKTKKLRLLNTKVDLVIPSFGLSMVRTNKGDLVRLWRKSEDEFIPLDKGTINKEVVIRQDGRAYKQRQEEYKQVEGDVAYWNVKRKEENRKMFDTESLLMKLLPFMPHLIGGVITIFVLYVLLDSLPTILGSLADLTEKLATFTAAQSQGSG